MQVNFILRTVGTSKGRYVGFLFLMFWVSKSTAAMMCYLPVFTGKAQRLSIFYNIVCQDVHVIVGQNLSF